MAPTATSACRSWCIKDAAGHTIGIRGANQDITERKQAEERLRASDAFRERVFDSSPIPLVVLDGESSRIVDCNAAAVAIYRMPSRAAVLGKGPLDFSAPVQYDGTPSEEKARALIARALAGETLHFEWLHRRPDGTRWDGEVKLMSFTTDERRLLQFTLHDITELKRTRAALEHSEALFRRTFDEAPVGAAVVTPAGLFQRVNAALCRFLGYSEAELVGQRFVDVTHPEDLEESRTLVRRLLQGEIAAFDQEKRYLRKDGATVWGRASVSLVRDLAGQPLHLVPIIQDINARKQTEEDLRRSEQRYATTLAAVNDGLWEWDVPTGTAYFSPSYYAVLGYADGAFPADYPHWRELLHPEDIARVETDLRHSVDAGLGFSIDLRMKTATGDWRWCCTRGNTIERDAQGQARRMVGTLSDASRRKQAEAELYRTRAILQVAMDQSPVGIAIADAPGGELRYVNDAGLAIGGGDRATIVDGVGIDRYVASWNLLDLDGQPLPTDQIPMVRALTRGENARREFLIRRGENDDRTVVSHAAPIRDETGRIIAGVVVFLDITDLKHAERNLEQFFTLVPDMVCIASADGRFLVVNDAWERVLGYTKAELMAVPFSTFVHPDDLAATAQASTAQHAGQPAASFVNRYRAKDGTYHWLEWNGSPLNESGILFAAARDITEHRRAEEAIRESEVRFRTLADSGQALIWTSGLDKKCNYFNQPWLDFTGRSLAQELGDGWTEGVHPDDFDRCVATYVAAFDRREKFSMDYRIRHRSGDYRWIQDNGSPRFDSHGEFLGYIGHCLDITERKQAEQALVESEERLRITLETTQIGVWDWDVPNDRWTASPTYYSMLGYPPKTGPGDRAAWVERVHPDDRALVTERIAAVLSGSVHTYAYEARMRHADGSYRWQSVRGDVVARDPEGRPIRLVGTRIDISLRRIAEDELRQKTALLEAQLDSTLDGILVVDEQGKKLLQNRRMSELWKIPPEIADNTDDRIQVRYVTQKTRNPEQFAAQVAHLYSHPQETSRDEVELVDGTVLDRYSAPVRGPDARYYGRIWTFRDITERKRADQALRESEQKHRLLLQNLHAGVVVHDPETHILLANDQASVLLGLTAEQMLGKVALDPAWCFLREDGAPMPHGEYPVNQVRSSRAPLRNLVLGIRHATAASPVWVLVNGFPHLDADGALHQIVVTFVDITKLKHAEDTLRETLREREALLKEVHHRVKNNLQIISSLLRLQAGQIEEPTTVQVLQDMQGRIRSMALLHETLYRSDNLAQVDLAAYLEAICTQLLRAHQHAAALIDLHLEIAPLALDATQSVPCGLLVNELVSNALKHAFPSGRDGEIRVALQPVGPFDANAPGPTSLRLSVTDNGVGLPAHLEVKNLRSLGLQLSTDLARQLHGTLELGANPTGGAAFAVTFTPPPGSVSSLPAP